MTIDQLRSLNDDETAMLWYIINKLQPPVLSTDEMDPSVFTSINKYHLVERVLKAEQFIKDEAKPIYESLKLKLDFKQ